MKEKKMVYIGEGPIKCARCMDDLKAGECVIVPYYVTTFIDARGFVYGSNAAMDDIVHADCNDRNAK